MKKIGFVITAGHLDIEWYQPLRSYRFWTVEAIEDLKKAAMREDFTTYVLDGQYFPLEEYLEVVPNDEQAMRDLIASGKLAIGPFYTQFDEWLPSAENMIRNCLFGKRKSQAMGGYMCAGYLPDNFGHPYQIPQILNNFGIDSLLFMRGLPEIEGGHPDEFMYEGIDGSRVLTSHFRESYCGAFDIFNKDIDPMYPREVPYYSEYLSFEWHKELANHDDPMRTARNMVDNVVRIAHRYPSNVIPLIAGFDHLPPQINVGETIACANQIDRDIEFKMGTVEDYIRLVQSQLTKEPTVYNMELIGSMYQYVLLGALSTRTYLKRQNFACEALLERYTEPLEALASLYGYPNKPTLLKEAWRFLLINSAHDSIHGSSTDEVHVEMEARFAGVRQIASGVIHDALGFMGRKLPRWWQDMGLGGIVAYAPVPKNREQTCEAWLPIGERNIVVINQDGKRLPTQVIKPAPIALNGIGLPRNDRFPAEPMRKVLFQAESTGGIDTFTYLVDSEHAADNAAVICGDNFLENEYLKVSVCGGLIHIHDKRTSITYYNLNLIEEDADAGDAWDYAPSWVPGEVVRSSAYPFDCRLVTSGPVRATLECIGALSVPKELVGDLRSMERTLMPFTFRITLERGSPRVDVKLTFDNKARDHRVRLKIPFAVKTDTILSQGHLAILDRPITRQVEIERWLQPPTQLMPCREWIAARDEHHGLAVALKGLYDYEAVRDPLTRHPEVAVTLLRGFELMSRRNTKQRMGDASSAHHTPGAQCLGKQEIEWSYVPFAVKSGNIAPFLPDVQSFLYPSVAHAVRSAPDLNSIDHIKQAISFTGDNIQFSACKMSYENDATILRLYENQGLSTTTQVDVSCYSKAWLSNMDEQPIEPLEIVKGKVTLPVPPYKVVTLRLVK